MGIRTLEKTCWTLPLYSRGWQWSDSLCDGYRWVITAVIAFLNYGWSAVVNTSLILIQTAEWLHASCHDVIVEIAHNQRRVINRDRDRDYDVLLPSQNAEQDPGMNFIIWNMLVSKWFTSLETCFLCFPYISALSHSLLQRTECHSPVTWLTSCDTSWSMSSCPISLFKDGIPLCMLMASLSFLLYQFSAIVGF